MKPEKQIHPESLERALKVLHAVADLCVAAENKGPPQGSEDIKADHEEYLTVSQAAERIKYREQTLRNMMSAGVFRRGVHYYKRRGRVLFLWSRMEHWLREDSSSCDDCMGPNSALTQNTPLNEGNEPFYPVHRARSRKKRPALL